MAKPVSVAALSSIEKVWEVEIDKEQVDHSSSDAAALVRHSLK